MYLALDRCYTRVTPNLLPAACGRLVFGILGEFPWRLPKHHRHVGFTLMFTVGRRLPLCERHTASQLSKIIRTRIFEFWRRYWTSADQSCKADKGKQNASEWQHVLIGRQDRECQNPWLGHDPMQRQTAGAGAAPSHRRPDSSRVLAAGLPGENQARWAGRSRARAGSRHRGT